MKPKKKSIITRLSLKKMQPFEELILDALAQFRTEGYVEKLKTSITQESCLLTKMIYLNSCTIRLPKPLMVCASFVTYKASSVQYRVL
jgi:hypothetical protein